MTDWLTISGSFEMGDKEHNIRALMGNIGAVNHLLTTTKTPIQWDDPTLDEVYLVFSTKRGSIDLNVSPVPSREVGLKMFTVEYDWMTPSFLDPRTGPWNILSYVALVLAGLDGDQVLQVPTLTDPD